MSLKQIETVLENNAISTWERLRGSEELTSFISRREQALALVEADDSFDL